MTQAALYFGGKVDMTRRIDQVDRMVFPLHAGRGTRDRNTTFLLQLHVIHGCPATSMHFLHLVDAARVKQNPLAQRGFARVNVRGNTNVAEFR